MSDFLTDDNFDLVISASGDFETGESTEQEVEQIIWSNKGEWKESPVIGFGIESRLKQTSGGQLDNVARFVRELKVELGADGKGDAIISLNPDLSDFKVELNG